MAASFPADDASAEHLERFLTALARSLAPSFEVLRVGGGLRRLVLSKPTAAAGDLVRVDARPIELKGEPHLQLVARHRTHDVTRNVPRGDAVAAVRALIGATFLRAHLRAADEELQLMVGKRGQVGLHRKGAATRAAPCALDPRTDTSEHDRPKRRRVDPRAPYLRALGVTDDAGEVIPAMARKWRQIDKFVEVLDHALGEAGLFEDGTAQDTAPLRIVDFGCGKGYLTFAAHEHLRAKQSRAIETIGVELRQPLVDLCNEAARAAGIPGLRFERGDIADAASAPRDVMIALHACDTATDHALHLGVRSGARVLVCSPCCHKELRPQVATPAVLAPLLRHGIHLGQEAEMVTDSLRALLVEAEGYDAKVFEFVSLEHTSKNKMLVAVRRQGPLDEARRAARLADVASLKAFYGVREQRLETLLAGARG